MAAQREPGRDCLAVDQDGDIWSYAGDEWVCQSNAGGGSWADLEFFGPFQIFSPQTDDGAAVAAQSMGGSLPPAAPSSLTEACTHSESMYGRCVACGMTWEQQSSSRGPGPAATIGGQPGPVVPRRFQLYRHSDPSGVSGTGVVAEGVEFADGSVALHWPGEHASTAVWGDLDGVLFIHGHGGQTEVRWMDDEPIDLWPAEGGHRVD